MKREVSGILIQIQELFVILVISDLHDPIAVMDSEDSGILIANVSMSFIQLYGFIFQSYLSSTMQH